MSVRDTMADIQTAFQGRPRRATGSKRRSYDHSRFADLDSLARRKRELGLSRERGAAHARGGRAPSAPIIEEILALNERAPLVDQVLVVDAGSADGSAEVAAAARRGGLRRGRAAAAARARRSARATRCGARSPSRAATWSSTSTPTRPTSAPHFVYGLLGPLLSGPEVRFVKGAYSRPWTDGDRRRAGRRRPRHRADGEAAAAISSIRELAGFAQPLAGEIAAHA